MHRIDADAHVSNQFSDGDSGIGQPGTKVDAAWLNAVQEELCHLVEGLGLTLTKADRYQLVNGLIKAALVSLTGTGAQAIKKTTAGGLTIGTGASGGSLILRAGDVDVMTLSSGVIDINVLISMVAGLQATSSSGTALQGDSNTGVGVAGGSGIGTGLGGMFSSCHTTTKAAVRGAVNLDPQQAPSGPADGDMWVESGTNTLKVRINGVTKTVTLT